MQSVRTRTLEVTVLSGENLCLDQTPVTENTYVVVQAESSKCWSTKMAKQGEGSLSTLWNEKLMLEMPLHAQSITFEVQCKSSIGRVRSIGLARIAITDVMPREEGCLEVLSYRLRNWEGRRSGAINFSVKPKKEDEEKEEKEQEIDSMWTEMKGSITVNSGIGGVHRQDKNANNNSRYVMGIPVWRNHPGIHV